MRVPVAVDDALVMRIFAMALAFVSTGVHITDRHSMFFRPDLESTLQPMNSSSRKRLSRRRREVSSRVRTKPNQLRVWAGARRRRTGLSRIRAVVSNCPLGVSLRSGPGRIRAPSARRGAPELPRASDADGRNLEPFSR